MKAMLQEIVRQGSNPAQCRSLAREYLQARILLSLQDSGAFSNWAFLGGTALRFLYRLPRYSEDLDFSLWPRNADLKFDKTVSLVQRDLEGESYSVDIKVRDRSAVATALVRFRDLLYELDLSNHRGEVLSIKIEIDKNPPKGAGVETKIIRRHVLLHLLHYNPASLFAGKLHGVLMRKYTKGRDLYDLAWYLSSPEWPEPNLGQLNNALLQTGWDGPAATEKNWRQLVRDKLDQMDWKQALADVSPFLESPQDTELISKEVLLSLLESFEEKGNNP